MTYGRMDESPRYPAAIMELKQVNEHLDYILLRGIPHSYQVIGRVPSGWFESRPPLKHAADRVNRVA